MRRGRLAAASAPHGRIVGIDISPQHLAAAQQHVFDSGLQDRVHLEQCDLGAALPFADNTFDWVWSSDVLFGGAGPEQVAVTRELTRVVKPGGTLAFFFSNFYRATLLPGYSFIEHLLKTASTAPFRTPSGQADPAARNRYELANEWLSAAGLSVIKRRFYPLHYQYPLSAEVRLYLDRVFRSDYGYGGVSKESALAEGMPAADWETWLAISDPASPHYILDHPSYYCFRYATLVTGGVPEA